MFRQLFDRGFVERVPDPRDRRCVTHNLTPAGHAALEKGDASIRTRLERVVSHLPARTASVASTDEGVGIDVR